MPFSVIRVPLIILLISIPCTMYAQVAINEVMASNSSTIADEDGDYEDWIELYNYSPFPIHLEGHGLSDDYDNPLRWIFPDITIEPGEYLLIWASNKDRRDPGQPLHTNFAISSAGEEVLLSAPNGMIIDEIEARPIPNNISLGRYPNGLGDLMYFDHPTPSAPNEDNGYQNILSEPLFSISPGFYSTTHTLEIIPPAEGATIYYTTDGSKPTTESLVYESPIKLEPRTGEKNVLAIIRTNPIEADAFSRGWIEPEILLNKAHTIRAKAKKTGHLSSSINTGTWFMDIEERDIPVLSLTTEPDHFFHDDTGIYVPGAIYNDTGYGDNQWGKPNANYFQRGREWERPASLEWFEQGQQKFRQDIGVRIHGGGSRSLPMKSLRLYARGSYGQTHFEYPLFEDQNYAAYKRFLLRNSGQDFYQRSTMFRDAFMQTLVRNLNFDTQAYRPVILFLNGEYWGIHNVRERYDKYYFERVYSVEEENLDLLTGRHLIKEGSDQHYMKMLEFIENNCLSEPGNYAYIQTQMDIKNYIDYVIANVFFRNTDWPANNIDFWRYSGPIDSDIPEKDGKWRWLLFDTDFGFGLSGGRGAWEFNMMEIISDEEGMHWYNRPWSTLIIRALFESEDFREKFITRFSDLLNTTFQPTHISELIDHFHDLLAPEIETHIDRWSYPESVSQWESNIQLMKTFGELRPEYQWNHLKDHFDLKNRINVTIDSSHPNAGSILLNTLKIHPLLDGIQSPELTFPWTGSYFPEIPISVSADPVPGFSFSHWIRNGKKIQTDTLKVTPEQGSDLKITAVFIENDDYYNETFPEAYVLGKDTSYHFLEWPSDTTSGVFPESMAFVYMEDHDPGLSSNIAGFTNGAYDLDSRTRINGLDEDGFAFINTSNEEGNPGYPGRTLGGALLALDTRDVSGVQVEFTAGTVRPNSREYHLRLQYRIGDQGDFHDVLHSDNSPVEYRRNEEAGHQETIGPVSLPPYLIDLPYVQLLWRYYYIGIRFDEISGARTKILVDEIKVSEQSDTDSSEDEDPIKEIALHQNYPNPFNENTTITFSIPDPMHVNVRIYDINGRLVETLTDQPYSPGTHRLTFSSEAFSSGVYLYVLDTGTYQETKKMLLVK
ncbi:CotH kinase family protein [Balneolaceae bacterium ANBcel3]|nr:CotH kinase family protein [Balneolaceae bacterium ANBcel3]